MRAEEQAVYKRGDSGPARVVREARAEDVITYRSTEYGRFTFARENREIYPAHLEHLTRSIRENGYLKEYPVHVVKNAVGDFIVVDGQHRFMACKNLGQEVFFTIKEGSLAEAISAIRIANAFAKAWKDEDYLRHFTQAGYPAYIKLQTFMKQWTLPVGAAMAVIARGFSLAGGLRQAFRHGDLHFDDDVYEAACATMLQVNEIRYSHERLKGIKNDQAFIRALVTMVNIPGYNHEKMLEHLPRCYFMFVKCSSVRDYIAMLGSIYNHGMREHNRVDFSRLKARGKNKVDA